jgi:hypothetical protein
LEEVERRVVEHELDLDRIGNTELQERIEDVLNDILVIVSPLQCSHYLSNSFQDFMVLDARASSSEGESETDSSGTDDSDDASDSDYPPNKSTSDFTHNPGSDAVHVHQAHQYQQRPHHEAGHANNSRASSRIQGPHLPPDTIHPISVTAAEHVPALNTGDPIVEEPQPRPNDNPR